MSYMKPSNGAANIAEITTRAIKGKVKPPKIPAGYLHLRATSTLRLLWEEFTNSRPADEWLPYELISVAKAVDLEIKIRKLREDLEENGYTDVGPRGGVTISANLQLLKIFQEMQLTLLRHVGLSMTTNIGASRQKSLQTQKMGDLLDERNRNSLLAK